MVSEKPGMWRKSSFRVEDYMLSPGAARGSEKLARIVCEYENAVAEAGMRPMWETRPGEYRS